MIRDYALDPGSGIAQKYVGMPFVNVVGQTNAKLLAQQIGSAFRGLGVSIFSQGAVTAVISADVGHLAVGKFETLVNLGIGADPTKFKLNAALLGLSTAIDAATGLPTIVQKAITDNLPFSSADTINVAAAAGQFWGAWRIFMNADGSIGTRASAADQHYATDADAKRNAPPAVAPEIDMGTISVQSAAGVAFTATVDSLAGAGVTDNYNGVAAGFTSWLTGAITPVEGLIVPGVLIAESLREAPRGSMIMARYTSDGAGATVGASLDIRWRVFPLNGEVEE